MRRRGRTRWATMAVVAVLLSGCSGQSSTRRGHFTVAPAKALLDVPIAGSLSGLAAHARVTVTATATDTSGVVWRSSAVYVAGPAGAVDLSQAPVSGSYSRSNSMGLLMTMRPSSGSATAFAFGATGYTVDLRATVDGRQVASTTVVRETAAAVGVTEHRLTLAHDGLVGTAYTPPGPVRTARPAVLLFGGSEGGESFDYAASQLAAHGYPTLSVAYFDEPGLPKTLHDIPLEYFKRALGVLAAQPHADPRHLLVWGSSRGGELALLLGATYPSLVHGVIAGSPSSQVNGDDPHTGGAAWTLGGKAVPYTHESTGGPDPAVDPQAVIPVERIAGPILTICGRDDQVWQSCDYEQAVLERRTRHHVPYRDVALSYPLAGHLVGAALAYLDTTSTSLGAGGVNLGGTVEANAEAAGAASAAVLSFLAAQ